MYNLIILLIFNCPSNLEQTKELVYPQKEYTKAVSTLNEWNKKLKEHYTEDFQGETCELSRVVSGKRRK